MSHNDHEGRQHCVHGCGRIAARSRGLCRACHRDPAIRRLYPLPGEQEEEDAVEPSRDRGAIGGAPRSEEKIAEMERLARLRRRLFSGNDGPVNNGLQLNGLPLGQRVRRLRSRKGWSYRQLARRAGVSHQAIFLLESRERQPRVATMRKLAVALGEPLTTLLGA